jgi:hypothetical protein
VALEQIVLADRHLGEGAVVEQVLGRQVAARLVTRRRGGGARDEGADDLVLDAVPGLVERLDQWRRGGRRRRRLRVVV